MHPNNYLLSKKKHVNSCLKKNTWLHFEQNKFISSFQRKYSENTLKDVFVYRNKYVTILTTNKNSIYDVYNSYVYISISNRKIDLNEDNIVSMETNSYDKYQLHFESIYEIFFNIDNFCV